VKIDNLQELSDTKKKIIIGVVVAVLGVCLFYVYIETAKIKIRTFNQIKFTEELNFPKEEVDILPQEKIDTSEITDEVELLKQLMESEEANQLPKPLEEYK